MKVNESKQKVTKVFLPNNLSKPIKHWHPESEAFCGGDTLLTALSEGWEIRGVFHQNYRFSGRSKSIYHLILKDKSQTAVMRVICNPFIENFIKKLNYTVYTIYDTKQIPSLSQLQKIAT